MCMHMTLGHDVRVNFELLFEDTSEQKELWEIYFLLKILVFMFNFQFQSSGKGLMIMRGCAVSHPIKHLN